MTTVYVREQGAVIRKRHDRLVVTKGKEELMDLPLVHAEQVVLMGHVQLTTAAAVTLLQHKVHVVFLTRGGGFIGYLLQDESVFAELRHAQMRVMSDDARALVIARQVVMGKLASQRVVLQRQLAGQQPGKTRDALAQSVKGIGNAREGAAQATNLDSLRGYEGNGAVHYFAGIKALLDPAWGFKGREYYPAPDPFNALLSFGYSLLRKDSMAAVQIVGLDPYLGFFHVIEYGRPSLTYDMMEEFRPVLVDTLVLELVQRSRITPADFVRTGRQHRPIEMNSQGREVLIRAYEDRLETTVQAPRPNENTSYRRCIELQVRQVAAIVLGKTDQYAPFALR